MTILKFHHRRLGLKAALLISYVVIREVVVNQSDSQCYRTLGIVFGTLAVAFVIMIAAARMIAY